MIGKMIQGILRAFSSSHGARGQDMRPARPMLLLPVEPDLMDIGCGNGLLVQGLVHAAPPEPARRQELASNGVTLPGMRRPRIQDA